MYRLWRDKTLYRIWTQLRNPRWNYSDFNIWPNDFERHVVYWARLWDNFHQVWPWTTYPCLNCSVFWCWYVMSRCDLDLWPVDLQNPWYIKCHVINICTKFERIRAIRGSIMMISRCICTRCVALWPWPLTSWSWTFTALQLSCVYTLYKIWAKLNNARLSHWRFSTFTPCNFWGWCISPQRFSSAVHGPNFTKLGKDIGRSFLHKKFV